MKYKFKLQKLLDIRIKEEEESKIAYGKEQNKKNMLENKLDDLKSKYNEYNNMSNIKDIVTQKITLNYLEVLIKNIEETNEELIKQEENIKKAKEDFIQKQIKRKSLETLKEKQINEIKKEEERIEQLNNDEFALYAYLRKKEKVSWY